MPTTAWKSAGTVSSQTRTGGSVSWTNPSNATASDNTYATASLAGNASHWLWCTNFGFTSSDVPSGATINGMEMRWERKSSYGLAGEDTTETTYFKPIVGGAEAGTQKTNLLDHIPTSDTQETKGTSSDLWGRTYTQAEAVASDTGIAIAREDLNYSTETCSVDLVEMRYTYTEASTFSNKISSFFLVFHTLCGILVTQCTYIKNLISAQAYRLAIGTSLATR